MGNTARQTSSASRVDRANADSNVAAGLERRIRGPARSPA